MVSMDIPEYVKTNLISQTFLKLSFKNPEILLVETKTGHDWTFQTITE